MDEEPAAPPAEPDEDTSRDWLEYIKPTEDPTKPADIKKAKARCRRAKKTAAHKAKKGKRYPVIIVIIIIIIFIAIRTIIVTRLLDTNNVLVGMPYVFC